MAVKKETIIIPEVTPTFTVEEATAVRLGLTTVAEILEKRKKIIN